MLGDVAVRDVRAAGHPHRGDEGIAGRSGQVLVGDQGDVHPQAPGGAKDHLLHVARRGVGVDPDLQNGDS